MLAGVANHTKIARWQTRTSLAETLSMRSRSVLMVSSYLFLALLTSFSSSDLSSFLDFWRLVRFAS